MNQGSLRAVQVPKSHVRCVHISIERETDTSISTIYIYIYNLHLYLHPSISIPISIPGPVWDLGQSSRASGTQATEVAELNVVLTAKVKNVGIGFWGIL